jgi:hypothetical protein
MDKPSVTPDQVKNCDALSADMIPNEQDLNDADRSLFDRLADGELSEAQRRELLAGLDDEPDGWRRCALAFLESQCLREAFADTERKSPEEELAAATPSQITAVSPRPISPWAGRLGTVMAMAASFLAALWLGTLIIGGRPSGVSLPGGNEAMQLAADKSTPAKSTLPDNTAAGSWRLVSISGPTLDGRPGQSINLPAVERDNIDQQWLDAVPRPMPDEIVKALERTGHEVRQWREVMPVQMNDGRQLVLPVDQIEVRYVGGEAY